MHSLFRYIYSSINALFEFTLQQAGTLNVQLVERRRVRGGRLMPSSHYSSIVASIQ